jgi:hypothetical protein
LTAVPSIKAILDARMVTIRTQGPLDVCSALGVARAADSSQGDLIGIVIGRISHTFETPALSMT